ncbi:XkdX family protein [Clostridium botulinum]|nr:XkdX family protein [Clostridium botulinum]
MYNYIKEYYILGLYKNNQLDVFVNAKWITEEQKQEIINSKLVSQ